MAARALRRLQDTRSARAIPLVEALTGLISGYVGWRFGFTAAALGALVFAWALIAASFIDLDTQLLPDDITLPLIWVGLLFNLWGTRSRRWNPR